MKISALFPSKFVKAADLNGKMVTLTIAKLVIEELGHGNERERKPVLYFEKATKGMILNATNGKTIAGLYGDESDNWTGERITVYPDRVRAFGKMHDVIRVREEIPAQPKSSPQSLPPVEENEIDDEEDVTDADEGPVERLVDAETGEIIDDLWDTEESPAKPAAISPAQFTRITVLGADAYGKEYNGPKLAQWISKGSANRLEDLQQDEGDVLIKALEKKIKDDKAHAAEKAAAKKQPVTTA